MPCSISTKQDINSYMHRWGEEEAPTRDYTACPEGSSSVKPTNAYHVPGTWYVIVNLSWQD